MILRDQFFITCDEDMRCFLKEKGKLDLNDTLEQAQNFIESRESAERKWSSGSRNGRREFKGGSKEMDRKIVSKPKDDPYRNKEHQYVRDGNQFKSNWDFRVHKKDNDRTDQSSGCFSCGSHFHKMANCDKRQNGQRSQSMAMLQCDNETNNEAEERQRR